ncbi:MAG: proline--tRNA ligase [Nanoarchaeota archaeon]
MSKQKDNKGLTVKKSENFSEWYNQVVQKAELADYSDVKGFMVIRPNAYSIWEIITEYFNKRIKALGVRNAYFPLLIPESFFKKEAEHAKGFQPEVAWVSNREDERLAIRPTSETIMYDSYSKWIRSWRDLPLRINQWCNVVRWETKATRLFLRTREFLWQEGHCVYETEKECEEETKIYLKEYEKLCRDILAMPVLAGKKTEKEKFSGAKYTLSIEGIMPDGKALQMGTSHNLGQGFAKSFGISFLDKNEKRNTPWQNSWGVSTRLIGALTMVHGDDKGLVLPPKLAYNKVVIIPLLFKGKEKSVLKKAKEILEKLKEHDPILDDRDYSPGWKFSEWELKGIPMRIEIGPKDIQKKQVIIVRRDNGEKIEVKENDIEKEVIKLLENIQKSMLKKSEKNFKEKIVSVKNLNELKGAIEEQKIAKADFCNKGECEESLKEKVDGAKTLNMPLEETPKGKCVICGKKATEIVYIGKSH